MTNVKTDKRYLDIKTKISELTKNVSDIKETISKKAAELKQLAKSKKEFKVSRTLGDLTHQLFQKQEKTLKEKAEKLTQEIAELELDFKSTIRAIQTLEQRKDQSHEDLKSEAIEKNNVLISQLQKEFEEMFPGFFLKVQSYIDLAIDNCKLSEVGNYFTGPEEKTYILWVPTALNYIKKLLTKGYEFPNDEKDHINLKINDIIHNSYIQTIGLQIGSDINNQVGNNDKEGDSFSENEKDHSFGQVINSSINENPTLGPQSPGVFSSEPGSSVAPSSEVVIGLEIADIINSKDSKSK